MPVIGGFPKGTPSQGKPFCKPPAGNLLRRRAWQNTPFWKVESFSEQYNFTRRGKTFEKTVVYFPALVQSPIVKYQKAEIQNYAWVDYDRAIALLSFSGARQVLTEVKAFLTAPAEQT